MVCGRVPVQPDVTSSEKRSQLWYHIKNTTTHGISPAVEPLAEVDPEDRKGARAETPAPEAAAWLADPDKPREIALTPNMRYINWLADQPEWTGPLPGEDPTPESEE
jgi:hypothetical protein